jgi:hypothetical protein
MSQETFYPGKLFASSFPLQTKPIFLNDVYNEISMYKDIQLRHKMNEKLFRASKTFRLRTHESMLYGKLKMFLFES